MPTNQREHGAPENVLNQEPVNQQNTQQPVAWMLECPTMTGDTGWKLSWNQSGAGVCNRLAGEDHEKALYTAPPVPRDVLMAAMREVQEQSAVFAKQYVVSEPFIRHCINLGEIADRYASKVQTERCQCCGYLVTESEHKGCLRAGRAATQPEPVNQQMLAALKGLTEDIQCLIGESSGVYGLHLNGDLSPWVELEAGGRFERLTNLPDAHAAIAAAEAAQPVCQTCKGNGVIGGHVGQTPENFGYVTEDCPDCQQPASAQPVAVPDGYVLVPVAKLRALKSSINGDCYKGESWECETINMMLSAAQKPEGV